MSGRTFTGIRGSTDFARRRILRMAALGTTGLVVSCTSKARPAANVGDTIEQNKELVRRFFDVINKRDAALLNNFIAENFVEHRAGRPSGLEGAKTFFMSSLASFPDGHHVIEDQIAEGDKVVSRITGTGTHLGDFRGNPPTGKKITMSGIAIHRIENGKIVEHWTEINNLSLFQQVGAIPDPPRC